MKMWSMLLLVMPNFPKRSRFYVTLFICLCFLFVCLFVFTACLHCSDVSSASHTMQRMNKINEFSVWGLNRSANYCRNVLHQLINSSLRNIILFSAVSGKTYICIYKIKQKLAHHFINIWWYYFWYKPFHRFF